MVRWCDGAMDGFGRDLSQEGAVVWYGNEVSQYLHICLSSTLYGILPTRSESELRILISGH